MDKGSIEHAKELMENGWKHREELKFGEAETLLEQAKTIFMENEDWFNYTETLNHLAYLHKLKASQELQIAEKFATESYNTAREKGSKEIHALRAVISILESRGMFENAIPYTKKYIELQGGPGSKGDIESHLANFLLRTGKSEEALETVNKAIANIEAGWESEREPHRSVWKSKALTVKALILFNSGQKEEALKLVDEAWELAKEQKLITRLSQIKSVREMIVSS
ncbi:MAG: hypothetical protein UU77_C0002G0014 [candidate division WWE3 bacterium GW2011_GWC1_41_7]|uniref:MalT-like TPR region domain-containing protein n=4 Tax=Katanobacteria TaxID=422282 RepID=A0A0G0ZHK8_UNCKA|nr:MAG: hypothetical protein UU72_C0002G0037 [candidate division WWE3 bacterium GW2011_GWB1_41_6]KKS21463.1 MAG: hypothetical protein UU77_C0002G0014 [candidate division WWE3 bacterium GW2011_GWC1_41_7]KKS21551.1 MAG: hypothetical protein UU80_C0027G0003 [candidate division WWE3 bacterium GW2011_GWA1_41_8]OGC57126.1 MAG: hypothetical protein A2976_04715 [candidate division WWE3 bacterium RIFCSPLOWO2_01_FULL_41_9]